MWTVVYITSTQEQALRLKELLAREGILVNLRPLGPDSSKVSLGYEILVLESEAEEAYEILNSSFVR
ncbi:MAG TPA: glutamate decarboxylase [Moorella mulderi]|nr:glutamate decarboxylase [Moorella mulderi]